jgi:hypothetical protein
MRKSVKNNKTAVPKYHTQKALIDRVLNRAPGLFHTSKMLFL